MTGRAMRPPAWVVALIFVAGVVAALLCLTQRHPREVRLRGLLIDLELGAPDPMRHEALRQAFTQRLAKDESSLAGVTVTLQYAHFVDPDAVHALAADADFVLLSPQGTPWRQYRGDTGQKLHDLEQVLRELVLIRNKPVIGICGGHQFMALAFGGSVGFIDPALENVAPSRYPKSALAERGATPIQTLRTDPIFTGVAGHPGSFVVMESHYEEVKRIPPPFVNLARSELSEAQLIRFPGKLVYGMAFHPERGWGTGNPSGADVTAGRTMLANFLAMVAKRRS